MKLFSKGKDGGQESSVTGYWIVEIKWLFSIVLLKFEGTSREAYHSHAFNSISWVLKGKLEEYIWGNLGPIFHKPSWKPVITSKENCHKVNSQGTTWVLSFRGPWDKTWYEIRPEGKVVLTNGRNIYK